MLSCPLKALYSVVHLKSAITSDARNYELYLVVFIARQYIIIIIIIFFFAFLFQRISVLIQRFNAVAVLSTFAPTTPKGDV